MCGTRLLLADLTIPSARLRSDDKVFRSLEVKTGFFFSAVFAFLTGRRAFFLAILRSVRWFRVVSWFALPFETSPATHIQTRL